MLVWWRPREGYLMLFVSWGGGLCGCSVYVCIFFLLPAAAAAGDMSC